MTALEGLNGIVEQVSEDELCDAAARADRTGMYTCPHTAVGLAVLEKLVSRGTIEAGQRVVCISTANGLKFTEFKTQYHDRAIEGVESRGANSAVYLPADLGQVVDAINRHFDSTT